MRIRIFFIFSLSLLIGFLITGCQTIDMKGPEALYKAGNKQGAVDLYEKILPQAQIKKEKDLISSRIAEIRGEIAQDILAQINRLKSTGLAIPALAKAVRLLEANQRYDDGSSRLKAALEENQELLRKASTEFERLLVQAKAGEPLESWTAVYQALHRAMELDPTQGLDARLDEWLKKRDAVVPQKIESLLHQDDTDRAEQEFVKYSNEIPKPDARITSRLSTQIEGLRKTVLEGRLADLLNKKKYYTAYQLILDAKKPYLDQRLAEVRQNGAEFYKTKAKQDMAQLETHKFRGFFAAEKAWQLNPDDLEIFDLRRNFSDLIEAVITQGIAIENFSAPSSEPEAGKDFANGLMAYMHTNRPYGVQILERSKIDMLMKERGITNMSNLTTNSEFSQVKMFIMGDVTTLKVERTKDSHQGNARVFMHNDSVSNPQYQECLDRYGRDKRKWPVELQDIKPQKEVPKYEQVKYNYGTESVDGLMVVSVRATESKYGAVVKTQPFEEKVTARDTYSDAVNEAVPNPIPADALETPSDNQVKQDLRNNLAQKIGEFVLKSFKDREVYFYDMARNFIERREYDKAVAMLAEGYYYCWKEKRYVPKPEDNETYRKLRQAGLFDYTE